VLATRLVGAASVQNLLRLRAGLPVGHPARAVLRERSIEAGLPLARFVAARYRGRGEPLDDLYQVAALGLVKAVDGYDAGRQAAFTSYAVPTIVGALKRHVRDSTNPLTPNGCARCTFAPASASTSTAKYQP
jgi:RNA polymerase sigma-B factor